MGKLGNNSANQFVRECICTSLMTLMENRAYQDITITDITRKAGVSRMAYYRNYSSKEDILTGYLDELFKMYIDGIPDYEHIDVYQLTVKFFVYFRQHRKLIQNLIKANLSLLILKRFDEYLLSLFEMMLNIDSPTTSHKYSIHFLSGGIYKVLIEWVENGLKESDEEMAVFILSEIKAK